LSTSCDSQSIQPGAPGSGLRPRDRRRVAAAYDIGSRGARRMTAIALKRSSSPWTPKAAAGRRHADVEAVAIRAQVPHLPAAENPGLVADTIRRGAAEGRWTPTRTTIVMRCRIALPKTVTIPATKPPWPSMPGSKRVQRGFPMFSGESIILPEGCRERRLRALPRQSCPAGRSSLPPSARRTAPRQGANRVTPGRPRGIGEYHRLSCFRPGAMSWPVTRTSVIPVDRSGAAPSGRCRKTAVPRTRRRPWEN
jgi:hypothetical protein